MIQSKRIDVLVACAVVFAVVVSMALVVIGRQQAANGQLRKEPEYAEKVFGADIISVEIIADEDDWQAMLDNALSEQFIMVDVVVNGRRFNNVGIRPKGNSSLMQVASSGATATVSAFSLISTSMDRPASDSRVLSSTTCWATSAT